MADIFPRALGPARVSGVLARLGAVVLRWQLALLAIVVSGALLRFHGLDWDKPAGAEDPLQMHPDERHLSIVASKIDWPGSAGAYFDTVRSPLNPYNAVDSPSFVYGTFPFFLVKGVSTIAGDDDDGIGDSYGKTVVWGRRVTAAFDTLTILLVFGAGWALFGRRAGLFAALSYAFAVLPTQLAHFWTVDPYVTFFATATLLLAALSVRARRTGAIVALACAMGLTLGLGLASKVTAWPIVLLPLLAALIRVGLRDLPVLDLQWKSLLPHQREGADYADRPSGHWSYDFATLCLTFSVAMLVFRIAQPYAFEGPSFLQMAVNEQWRKDIAREIDFQNGNVDFPPFVQFAGRTPLLGPFANIVQFGLGPALGVAAWAALGLAAFLMVKRRELMFALPLALAIAVFAFQGIRFVSFMRYYAPMYPALCLFAGWGASALLRLPRRRVIVVRVPRLPQMGRVRALRFDSTTQRFAAAGLIGAVLFATAWWAIAFQSVYAREHPRIAASRWIYENIPAGTTITKEHWDDELPYPLPGRDAAGYTRAELELYQPDSPEKIRALIYGHQVPAPGGTEFRPGLEQAEYVVVSSGRVRKSVPRLEREYPATVRYYELLENGGLGFSLVATFRSRPSFLGLEVDDSRADESFTVYDHPTVRIYRKTANWNAEEALALLYEAHPERAVNLLPKQGRTNGLHLTAAEAEKQQGGGTFSDTFDPGGWASHPTWLWWFVWIQLAALATVPWLTWLFRAMPDRGYGLSKVAGLLSVGLVAWLLVAWDVVDFSHGVAWAAFAIVVGAGLAGGVLRRRALWRDLRARWPAWAVSEGVFLAVFAAVLLLRAWNPDLWHHPQGGEKPVELAFLTAVARSTELPPYDPWFAGGTMNYYYFGWFLLAVPMRALKILPEVAFNLALPTYAACAAAVFASTGYNLVALSRRRMARGIRVPRSPVPLAAGVVGAIFFIGIGNLDGGHQLIERVQHVNQWSFMAGTPVIGGAVGIVGGLFQVVFHGAALPPFDWWRSSRVHIGQFDITEFPYWSFLFGDLHPHLMGYATFSLLAATACAYVATAARGLRAQAWALAAMLGVLVAVARMLNTWDLPAAGIISVGAVLLGQAVAPGRRDVRFWHGVAHLVIAVLIVVVLFAPYGAHTEVANSGIERTPETTRPQQYFAHFGLFATIALLFLAVRYHEELRARRFQAGRNLIFAPFAGLAECAAFAVFVVGLSAFTWQFGVTVVALSILVLLVLANLIWLEVQRPQPDVGRLMATACFFLAFAIAAGVDVVVVKDDIVRMNTVFKFSLQAWQLFAIGAAYGLWYVMQALWRVRGWRPAPRPGRVIAAATATAVLAVLLFGSAVYLWSGTRQRQEARFAQTSPTLNGLLYLQYGLFGEDGGTPDPSDDRVIQLREDEPLIAWLRQNVEGSPVIVEAVGPLYHWTGRISWNTGLPAVVGWDWHTTQYRWAYGGLVQQRRGDTEQFYRTADPAFAARYLERYNVRYVIAGTEERVFGTRAGIEKFATMTALKEVFRSGENVIYRVDQDLLFGANLLPPVAPAPPRTQAIGEAQR